jgi:hypothetical protein
VTSSANWGDTGFWTGAEMRYDNGFDPLDDTYAIPDVMRLRGSANRSATAILSPLAGRATGRSDTTNGSIDGSVTSPEGGKVDFVATGTDVAQLFTGDATTGPIVYHYNSFTLTTDPSTGNRPLLTYRKSTPTDSLFPLIIFVEDNAVITGDVIVDGQDGGHGFNGANDGSTSYAPGGDGGWGGPGGGNGGHGGVSAADLAGDPLDPEGFNGSTGEVCANVVGPLDEFSEAMAGLNGMITGGGGHFDPTQNKDQNGDDAADLIPAYSGGGGGGPAEQGLNGGDWDGSTTPGETDQGVGGQQVGTEAFDFIEAGILATGGAGGGGGGGDDDGGGDGTLNDGVVGINDDGGGGGGGGGGFFGLACAFDVTLGLLDPPAGSNTENFTVSGAPPESFTLGTTLTDLEFIVESSLDVTIGGVPQTLGTDYSFDGGTTITTMAGNTASGALVVSYDYYNGTEATRYAVLRAVGGRGGSSYEFSATTSDPPVPADDMGNPDPTGPIGQGEAGGGGGGGGICVIAGGDLTINALVSFVHGKTGGNDVNIEGGSRNTNDTGGAGGAGKWVFADQNGIDIAGEIINPAEVIIDPTDPALDVDPDIPASVSDITDRIGMVGTAALSVFAYGSGPREAGFGATQIVTEFFDTLSDSVSYDEVRVLSNADNVAFPYDPVSPSGRTIRVLIDTTTTGSGGLPDFTAEDSGTGSFTGDPTLGYTHEIDLHYDVDLNDTSPAANSEARNIIPAGSASLGKRFVRVRIIFDLSVIGSPDDLLGNPGGVSGLGFALPGAADIVIAPGNTLGNLDTAPEGVPAVAEVRVRFTP